MDADQLQVLDLESNSIVELEQLEFLTTCQHLGVVCLLSNPVCSQQNRGCPDPTLGHICTGLLGKSPPKETTLMQGLLHQPWAVCHNHM